MSGSPWSDPATPTEPGAPYAGPPPTAQSHAGQSYAGQPPPYGYPAPYPQAPPWGPPGPWGPPAQWGPAPPRRPQRPGQVITAAVLAFVQALVVAITSLYVWFFASIAEFAAVESNRLSSPGLSDQFSSPGTVDALATEGTVLAIVQLLSAVLLVGAGIWALNSRRRAAGQLLAAALVVQVVLAGYWAVRLIAEVGGVDTDGTIAALALFYAVGPLVGLGMLLIGPGRRWFGGTPQP